MAGRAAAFNVAPGHRVTIIGGSYRGETGVFVRWPHTAVLGIRLSAYVRLGCHEHPDESVCLRIGNVQFDTDVTAVVVDDNNPPIANAIIEGALVTRQELDQTLRLVAESFQQLTITANQLALRIDRLERERGSFQTNPIRHTPPIVETMDDENL
jgi:hypothetical protein